LSEVILQPIVEGAKEGDKEVKEDPDGEKKTLSTLIDHPVLPFLLECSGHVGSHGLGGGCGRPLEGLKTPTLCLVALEVCGWGSIGIVI
jgi:hypothetical protein